MKMTYRKTSRTSSKKKWIISVLVAIFILVVINLSGLIFPQSITRGIVLPFIKIKEVVLTPFNGLSAYFGSKNNLLKENEELKQEVSALEFKILKEKVRLKDNLEEEYEGEFSPDGLQARVLIRPPFSPYDTFVISTDGFSGEIQEGNNIFVLGYFVGNIASIQGDTAIIKLRSSSGEKTVVRVSGVDAEAVGRGGGRFVVTIPKDVAVEIGDVVTAPGLGGHIIGAITNIEAGESGSFNFLYFSIPASLSKISFVTVTRN